MSVPLGAPCAKVAPKQRIANEAADKLELMNLAHRRIRLQAYQVLIYVLRYSLRGITSRQRNGCGFHDLMIHTESPLHRSFGQGWLCGTAKGYATRSRYRCGWVCSCDSHHCRRSPLAALGSQSAAACTARRWSVGRQGESSGRKQCSHGPPPARQSPGGGGIAAPGAYWSPPTDAMDVWKKASFGGPRTGTGVGL
jgi:hypothetical protein